MKITEILQESISDDDFTLPSTYTYHDLTKLPSDVYEKQWDEIIIEDNHALTSLEGANQFKCRNFKIYNCKNLKSLKGMPTTISVMFACNFCPKITSLEYSPQHVFEFSCDMTGISTLEGSPENVHIFSCGGIAWDEEFDKTFTNLTLKSLKGSPKETKSFYCECAPHVDLKNIWTHVLNSKVMYMGGTLNKKSPLLGFLRIKNLTEVNLTEHVSTQLVIKAVDILNKYLPLKSMSDIMKCKQELIKAGFKSNATF